MIRLRSPQGCMPARFAAGMSTPDQRRLLCRRFPGTTRNVHPGSMRFLLLRIIPGSGRTRPLPEASPGQLSLIRRFLRSSRRFGNPSRMMYRGMQRPAGEILQSAEERARTPVLGSIPGSPLDGLPAMLAQRSSTALFVARKRLDSCRSASAALFSKLRKSSSPQTARRADRSKTAVG